MLLSPLPSSSSPERILLSPTLLISLFLLLLVLLLTVVAILGMTIVVVVRGRGFWRVSTGDERAHHWHTPRPPCIHLVLAGLAARAAAAAAAVAVATADTHRRALLLASSRRSRDRLLQDSRLT